MTAQQGASGEGAGVPAGRASPYEVVALAASAGGVTALRRVLGDLPSDLAIPVLVVQHLDRRHRTVLAEVIGRYSALPVKLAQDQEVARAGAVYVAPPDHHLLAGSDGVLTLTRTELVHFVRPSADLLFESVAGAYGADVIACVLTGTGSDGAMGVSAVKARGGTVIVEDPATAEFRGMPQAALDADDADFVLPLDEIGQLIGRIARVGRS